MSGRTTAVLCLAAFLATADTPWQWVTAAWSAITAAAEEPSAPEEEPDDGTDDDEGWLIDPNG